MGLESQEAILNHFLKDKEVVATFKEVKSAKNIRQRPELMKAIKLCVKNGYTLAVAKLDRLSRKTEDALQIFNDLNQRLMSCDIPSMDKFTLTMFMAIADRERELIGIRTKAALKVKKEKGLKLGNVESLSDEGRKKASSTLSQIAYDNDNNRRMYAMICEYKKERESYEAIAKKLNDNGFKSSQGKEIHAMTVQRIWKRYCC